YPQNVDWFQSFTPVPLPALLDQAAARFGERPATGFFGKTMTYAELVSQTNRAAKGLIKLGVGKGTRVALLLPNCPAFVVYYYAILKAGGTAVSCNPLYTVPELVTQVSDAEASVLITLDLVATFPKAKALLERGAVKQVVVVPFRTQLPGLKAMLAGVFKRKDFVPWKAGPVIVSSRDVENNDGLFDAPAIAVSDIAVLQYTGGTTGTPKSAMLTPANLSINVQQCESWFPGLTKDGEGRFFCVIPFFHLFAMTSLMNFAISKASQMIMLPRFELGPTLKEIGKTRPTVMAGVPTLFNALASAPKIKDYDLSALEFCISGGAPLPLEVKRAFE